MSGYQGASALITGAGSGIGRALAVSLARRGAFVWLSDVDGAKVDAVAAEIGATARAARVDVRDAAAVREWVEGAARAHGRLDFLFNNAGMGIGGEAHELETAHYDRVIDITLKGVIHGVVAAYPLMVRQRSGHIVNTASLAGLGPAPLLLPYTTAKHAVVGLSTSLRLEAASYGVRVSVLCPAAVETSLLDTPNPADLPAIPWCPDLRRYLGRLTGPPYPVARAAEEALDAVARNHGIIVLPARARLAWRLGRFAPWLAQRITVARLAEERRNRGR
jgi:NAD(P)-dependent dehydrogenase (short-subunit alcohol dehydrogenase family)